MALSGSLPFNLSSMAGYGASDYTPISDYSLSSTLLPTQIGTAVSGASGVATATPNFMQGMVGYTDTNTGVKTNGWGGAALGLLQGLGSAYMGMKQYGMAKDQLAFSKDSFAKNYAAQRSMTNASLRDRQTARVASRQGASNPYQSVGDYMAQNGIA
jgi:hypothetical protein